MKPIKSFVVCVFLLFLRLSVSVRCTAQQAPTVQVEVMREHAEVVVQVNGPTNLAAVLEEFCKSTETSCEGTALAAKIAVFPTEVRGSWSEVISKLLEGSHLNFAALVPRGDRGGKLLIQEYATLSDETASPNSRLSSFAAHGSGRQEWDRTAEPSASTAERELSTNDDSSAVPLAGASDVAPPSLAQGQEGQGRSAGASPFPDSSGDPKGAQNPELGFLPFPDSNGNPKPIYNEPAQYSPFPNSNGDPMPVRPAGSGSPFPK